VVLDFLELGIQTAMLCHPVHVWAAVSAQSGVQLPAHLELVLQ